MATQKAKEIVQGGQPRRPSEAGPMEPDPTGAKATLEANKFKAAAALPEAAASTPRPKQLPLTAQQLAKPAVNVPAADTRPPKPKGPQRVPPVEQPKSMAQKGKERSLVTENADLEPADEMKPLDEKPLVQETFQSHGVGGNAKTLNDQRLSYFRHRRFPMRGKMLGPSLWDPTTQQPEAPQQASSGQDASSQTAYMVENYVSPPEGPPDSDVTSLQMAFLGVLIVFIIVLIAAWTLITLRRPSVLNKSSEHHRTRTGTAPQWEVSDVQRKFYVTDAGTTMFSANDTLSGENTAVAEDSDVEIPFVNKTDAD